MAEKKAPAEKAAAKKAAKKVPAKKTAKAPAKKALKTVDAPKRKRAKIVLGDVKTPKGVKKEERKTCVVYKGKDDTRVNLKGSMMYFTSYNSAVKGAKKYSAEDAKKFHLGNTRMILRVLSADAISEALEQYFG